MVNPLHLSSKGAYNWGREVTSSFNLESLMNKSELTDALSSRSGLTKSDADSVVNALFATDNGIITRALKGGDKVQITGFGTFEARKRKARMGRNPRTGEEIEIPARRVPAFRAGKGLKDAL